MGGSALHLLSVVHVITRLVISVQGDNVHVCFRPSIGQDKLPSACLCSVVYKVIVCVCVCFRPSFGQDGFPSACLCSVVYKVIVCVCVCVSDPVLAKMGSPLPVFVQ